MLKNNLLYALRSFRKSPGFTLVILLTLALGIGANTAIFSVVYAALLRPLPYRQPEQLVMLGESRQQLATTFFSDSYPDYLDWKKSAKTLQSIAAFSGDIFTLDAGGEPKNTFATQATPGFFSALGVRLALGRDFVDADVQRDIPRVAILTDALWRSDFAADPSVVGRVVHLDRNPVTVVGVLPRDFEFAPGNSSPLWVSLHPNEYAATGRNLRWLTVIGRLSPGVAFATARSEMEGITAQLAQAHPKEDGSTILLMASLRDRIVGTVRPLLLVLLGAVGFVLLITCANVANLLMTRSVSMRKEYAIRAALGASRAKLLGQTFTHSLLLSVFGAAFGILIAQSGVELLVAAIPASQLQTMPYLQDAGVNLPVLAFLCGVTVLAALLFGLAPGLSTTKSSVNEVLKDESRGSSSGHARLRNTLVVAEIAISLVLLVGAGLMLQSLRALLGHNAGFDLHNVLTFSVNLPDASYPSDKTWPYNSPSAIRFDHEFADRLRSLPGVVQVAATSILPVNGGGSTIRFIVEGRPTPVGQDYEADIVTIDPTYFSTLKIPLISGRFFNATDAIEAPGVLIVNQAYARAYFPNDDPLGKCTRFTYDPKEPFRQIVGVVGDTAEDDLAAPPPPVIYVPNDQGPSTFLSLLVRTAGDPAAFLGAARDALHDMDAQLPLIQPRTLEQLAGQSPSVFLRRYPSVLIGSFAALALILAMVGLYGLISYSVLQRTREIGIRVAMGAQRSDVLRLVLREGLFTAILGVAIGIVAGLLLTRLMSSLLYGVSPSDWFTFSSVSVLLLLVALAACTIPARRATRVDPIVALRYE
jgi:putative ABC transport system permease protein